MVVLASCLIGAVIIFFTFVAPSHAAVILAAGAYLATVIIALTGIVSGRKAATRHNDFARLRRDVDSLLAAEDRRLMNGLRVPERERSADNQRYQHPEAPLQ
jgi:hypothetical protein